MLTRPIRKRVGLFPLPVRRMTASAKKGLGSVSFFFPEMLDGTITPPLFFPCGRAPNLLSWSAPVPSPGSYVSGVSCVRGFGPRPRDRVVRLAGGAVSFCRPGAQPDARFQRRESPVVAHRASHCVGISTMSKKLSLLQEAGYVVSAFLRQEILALLRGNTARLPPS